MYGIPKSTLQRKVNSKNMMKVGRPNALSEKDEEKLVKEIIRLSSKPRYHLTSMDIRSMVHSYMKKNSIEVKCFTNNLPGYKWLNNFLNRNKSKFSDRLGENINIKRSRKSTTNL